MPETKMNNQDSACLVLAFLLAKPKNLLQILTKLVSFKCIFYSSMVSVKNRFLNFAHVKFENACGYSECTRIVSFCIRQIHN